MGSGGMGSIMDENETDHGNQEDLASSERGRSDGAKANEHSDRNPAI